MFIFAVDLQSFIAVIKLKLYDLRNVDDGYYFVSLKNKYVFQTLHVKKLKTVYDLKNDFLYYKIIYSRV